MSSLSYSYIIFKSSFCSSLFPFLLFSSADISYCYITLLNLAKTTVRNTKSYYGTYKNKYNDDPLTINIMIINNMILLDPLKPL